LPAQWLEHTSSFAARSAATLQQNLQSLAQPARIKRVRRLMLALLAVWAVFALVQLFWALWPQPDAGSLPTDIVNPISRSQVAPAAEGVNIERLQSWNLFGKAGTDVEAAALAAAQPESAPEREGIEDGARESRLDLTLRGILAASDDGLGHAIIEHRNQQEVYAVDDELPVSGGVKLAKVMRGQVVLDNNGTYELLNLFEESEFDSQLGQRRPIEVQPASVAPGDTTHVDKRTDSQASELASDYRAQLYENPQSLASLVRISAVRDGGELQGYRIAPGRDAVQFERLGFKAGDLVTGVNGIALDNPGNTVQLYQTMRDASEAVFELQRDGQSVSVSVELGAGAPEQ